MKSCRFAGVTIGVTIFLTACGDRGTSSHGDLESVIDTVGGVIHARNAGSAPEWRAEPVMRVGTIEGGSPEAFGSIRSVVADAEGNVYVADNMAQEIRVFTSEGAHVRNIGRQGGGPGEFGDLYSLAWLGNDLAVMDPGNGRIAVLSRDGASIDHIRHDPVTGPPSLIRMHPLGDDGFYAPIIDMTQVEGLPFSRITTDGPGDTISSPEPPAGVQGSGVFCRTPDGGITGIAIPQAPGLVFAFPPPGGAAAASWTEEYSIAFVGPSGDTSRVVTRDRAPAPYTDALWEEGMRPWHELRENFPGAQCEPSEPRRPRHRAALRHILFDEAGRMWVEAAGAAGDEGFLWEVFDAEGRLVGTLEAPPRASQIPPYVRGDHLVQVETDDLNVQYVAMYRVGPR